MALRALADWGIAQWPAGAERALQQALSQEPDPKVKVAIQKVFEGESWPEVSRVNL
jgi:hypothetical protein